MKKSNRPAPADGSAQLTDEQIEHKAQMSCYLREGKIGDLRELERKALVSTSDPDGGYLVDDEMDTSIDRIAATILHEQWGYLSDISASFEILEELEVAW